MEEVFIRVECLHIPTLRSKTDLKSKLSTNNRLSFSHVFAHHSTPFDVYFRRFRRSEDFRRRHQVEEKMLDLLSEELLVKISSYLDYGDFLSLSHSIGKAFGILSGKYGFYSLYDQTECLKIYWGFDIRTSLISKFIRVSWDLCSSNGSGKPFKKMITGSIWVLDKVYDYKEIRF